ncbi:MAG: SMP-30/gluconolactonase/LRE family protein [Xanthomonadales bacterium]|jgi:sugar lactone lactonase YvrE|nr:SMP-30/gluconolactonase/LRE family protein [Xanthomonadales bacterium]
MSRICLLLACCCAAPLAAQTLSGPESLEYDAAGERYLISNRSAGQILARAANGSLSVFTDDPGSPAGMEIVGEHVFVADGGRIRGYRLSDAVRVVDYAIAGATFLNGLSSDGNTRLWASDFTGQRLHQIDIGNLAAVSHTTPISATGFTPNGLWWDRLQQRLLIVSWGANARVYTWQPGQTAASLLVQTTQGNFDGVVVDCDGAVYVSSWGAAAILRASPPFTAQSTFSVFAAGQSNPADIAYTPGLGEIAVPNAGNSTLAFLPTACAGVLYRDGLEAR